MPKPIDLGRKLNDIVSISAMRPDEAHYPELCISDTDDKRIAKMPDKGTATIKYRVVSRTHREEKGRGYSCSIRLEVLSIDPPAGTAKNGDYDGGVRKAMNDYFKDRK
jgi:hypothetical protein